MQGGAAEAVGVLKQALKARDVKTRIKAADSFLRYLTHLTEFADIAELHERLEELEAQSELEAHLTVEVKREIDKLQERLEDLAEQLEARVRFAKLVKTVLARLRQESPANYAKALAWHRRRSAGRPTKPPPTGGLRGQPMTVDAIAESVPCGTKRDTCGSLRRARSRPWPSPAQGPGRVVGRHGRTRRDPHEFQRGALRTDGSADPDFLRGRRPLTSLTD